MDLFAILIYLVWLLMFYESYRYDELPIKFIEPKVEEKKYPDLNELERMEKTV